MGYLTTSHTSSVAREGPVAQFSYFLRGMHVWRLELRYRSLKARQHEMGQAAVVASPPKPGAACLHPFLYCKEKKLFVQVTARWVFRFCAQHSPYGATITTQTQRHAPSASTELHSSFNSDIRETLCLAYSLHSLLRVYFKIIHLFL